MLRNEDFLKFYSNGKGGDQSNGGGGNSNDKVRFDLKQIKKWDQEIKNKSIQSNIDNPNKKKYLNERKEKQLSEFSDSNEYRDRAKERRIQEMLAQKEEEENSSNRDVAVSKLTTEQTQYLGGNFENTHLVKGLDYLLLNKVRNDMKLFEQQQQEKEKEQENEQEAEDAILFKAEQIKQQQEQQQQQQRLHQEIIKEKRLDEIKPISTLGSQMKNYLISKSPTLSSSSTSSSTSKLSTKETILLSSRVISTISRSTYEFDINPLSLNDLPTTLMRSKDDIFYHNGYDATQICLPYLMNSTLMTKLSEIFHDGDKGILERNEKKIKEGKLKSLPSSIFPTPSPNQPPKNRIEPINIFDDITDKYEPSLPTSSVSVSLSTSSSSSSSQMKTKNYFSNSSFVSTNLSKTNLSRENDDNDDDGANSKKQKSSSSSSSSSSGSNNLPSTDQEDLLAPVKKLVAAQMIKQSILSNQSKEIIIEKGKTHRDIFGGLEINEENEKRKRREGHSMTEHQEEDISGMDYEFMEEMDGVGSDEDGEEGGGGGGTKKKKKKTTHHPGGSTGGGSGGGGGGGGGGKGNRGGGGQPPNGMNRAARRAAARGE